MGAHVEGDNSWQTVVHASYHTSSTLSHHHKWHYWKLLLACGHTVERRIRWLPDTSVPPNRRRRGWGAIWHGASLDRLPPEPKRARCGYAQMTGVG